MRSLLNSTSNFDSFDLSLKNKFQKKIINKEIDIISINKIIKSRKRLNIKLHAFFEHSIWCSLKI